MIIDSNVLVYSLNSSSPKHKIAKKFIQVNKDKLVVAHQNIFETLRVLSHPTFPNHMSGQDAVTLISTLVDHFTLIHPNSQTPLLAFGLIQKYGILGNQVFDAYLVATALSNGVNILATDNLKHMGKYQEIKVVNPFE